MDNSKGLAPLRSELDKINTNIFNDLQIRKEIVGNICKYKAEIQSYSRYYFFDYERENKLFLSLVDRLETLSIEEMASFSLMIESHVNSWATKEYSYPRWSKLEHLNFSKDFSIEQIINPVLLKIYFPDEFKSLKFSDEFNGLLEL
jgi:hypothetical protein